MKEEFVDQNDSETIRALGVFEVDEANRIDCP